MFGLYALFWVGMFILLIYFAIKRVQTRKKETFEKRDN